MMRSLALSALWVVAFGLGLSTQNAQGGSQQTDSAWVRIQNWEHQSQTGASRIAIADSGAVYVCGLGPDPAPIDPSQAQDIMTVKRGRNGDHIWSRLYGGSNHSIDGPTGIVIDDAGNVVVCGYVYNTSSGRDVATLKYGSDGALLWDRQYTSVHPGGPDDAQALSVGSDGSVYVTGSIWNGSNTDYLTLKYDSSGNFQWARTYNGGAGVHDVAHAMGLDAQGNAYLTGNSYPFYVTISYDPSGGTRWLRADSGLLMYPYIQVDAPLGVYVGGNRLGPDGVVTMHDPATGALLWTARVPWSPTLNTIVEDVQSGPSKSVYFIARSAVIKFDSSGALEWLRSIPQVWT